MMISSFGWIRQCGCAFDFVAQALQMRLAGHKRWTLSGMAADFKDVRLET